MTDSSTFQVALANETATTHLMADLALLIGPGDVIIIPGKTPHWFSSQDADLRYLIFRPDPEGKSQLK